MAFNAALKNIFMLALRKFHSQRFIEAASIERMKTFMVPNEGPNYSECAILWILQISLNYFN